jgi:general secretion pathway protein G
MTARRTAQGFTLVEILIVVVILGILAAIVIPQFTQASESARASSLVSQLQTIRSQLELYQVQHNGNYPTLTTNWDQMTQTTDAAGATTGADFGPYLQQAPRNSFTGNADLSGDNQSWDWDATNNSLVAVIPATVDDADLIAAGLTPGIDFIGSDAGTTRPE